jgi:hypothetical protein
MLNLSRNKAIKKREDQAKKMIGINQSMRIMKGMKNRNTTKIDTINLILEKKSQSTKKIMKKDRNMKRGKNMRTDQNMKKDLSMTKGKNTRIDQNMMGDQSMKRHKSTMKDQSMEKDQNTMKGQKKKKNRNLSLSIPIKIKTLSTNLTTAMKSSQTNSTKMVNSNTMPTSMTLTTSMLIQMIRPLMTAQTPAIILGITKSQGSTMHRDSRLNISNPLVLS